MPSNNNDSSVYDDDSEDDHHGDSHYDNSGDYNDNRSGHDDHESADDHNDTTADCNNHSHADNDNAGHVHGAVHEHHWRAADDSCPDDVNDRGPSVDDTNPADYGGSRSDSASVGCAPRRAACDRFGDRAVDVDRVRSDHSWCDGLVHTGPQVKRKLTTCG